MTFVDLSYPLSSNTPLFPGTPCVELESIERTEDPPPTGRRSLNVTRLSMVVHTGTHMDAPFHFFPSGLTIDQMPLEQCMGPASLLKLTDLATGSEIDLTAVPGLKDKLSRTRKLILNTGWARHWGSPRYFTDHPRISAESAAFLVDCGINLIGVDMPSVDRPPFPAHLALLGNGIAIVENLTNLDAIDADEFQLTVLPLKLMGRDASPVRAIAFV